MKANEGELNNYHFGVYEQFSLHHRRPYKLVAFYCFAKSCKREQS